MRRPLLRRSVVVAAHGWRAVAVARRVPVVPMTIHGTHESTFVLTRGRRIARLTGLDRLHVKVFPLIFGFPFGITPAFVPTLQLPAKITVEIGDPLDWRRFEPSQAADPIVLGACYDEISAVMQETLDRLVAEHPYPVLTRLRGAARRGGETVFRCLAE